MVKVKKNLRHLETVAKNLTKSDKFIFQTAEHVNGEIIELWSKGKGANGRKMKGLTPRYRIRKEKSGRRAIRDLVWTGDLYRSFITKKASRYVSALTFTRDAMGKAVGNYNKEPRMMTVGKKLRKQAVKFFNHLIYPWR